MQYKEAKTRRFKKGQLVFAEGDDAFEAYIVFLGSVGFVSTATLFSAVGIRTRARDLMLSVVVFPLVAPALLASAVATRELFAGATTAEILGWVRILGAFDLLFVAFGVWVSRYLLSET